MENKKTTDKHIAEDPFPHLSLPKDNAPKGRRNISITEMILIIFFTIVGCSLLIGGWAYTKVKNLTNFAAVQHVQQSNTVQVLENIDRVLKLITVEGQFATILDHKDYVGYDIPYLFQKKALLKVKADVSVGYDLEKLTIKADHTSKTLNISGFPEPEVLAIDPDISYYDIQEGYFNIFTPEELTALSKKAKNMVVEDAYNSQLIEAAKEQAAGVLNLVEIIAQSGGWQVVYDEKPTYLEQPILSPQSKY